MSDMAKKARTAMKERAQRRAEPVKGDVDASGWREPTINSAAKTGMRPISKRAFKRGGKVNLKAEGKEGMKHAGRKPRASGGMTVDDYINRDQKIANEKRGYAHVGGYKKGGKTKHDDVAMDKKLIKSMVSKKALKKADGGQTVNREGKGDYAGSYPADLSNADLAKIRASQAAQGKKEQQWQNTTAVGKKHGGKAAHGKACACKACGGRMGRASGGEADDTPPDAMAGGYNEDAVNKAIASSNRSGKKIGKKEAALIHSLLKGRTERKDGGRTKKKGGGGFGIDNPFKGKAGDALDTGAQLLSPAYSLARGKSSGLLGMAAGMMGKKNGGKTGKGNYEGGTRPTGGRIAKMGGGSLGGQGMTARGDQRFQNMSDNLKGMMKSGMDPVMALMRGMRGGDMGDTSPFSQFRSSAAARATPAGGGTPYAAPASPAMARKSGGRTKAKGKTNIHININTAPKPDAMGMPMPLPPMPLKPPPGLPPAAAMGAPGMLPPAGAAPMPPAGGAPMGIPPGAPPMMGRKAGGRVYRSYKDMDAGAGGGLGRLEKTEIQKRKG